MNTVTTDSFTETVLNADQPVLVDFTAEWCPPCKMLKPLLAEIEREHGDKIRIVALDVDHNPDVQFEYGVMGLPTLILFADGEPQVRIMGFHPKPKLLAKLSAYL